MEVLFDRCVCGEIVPREQLRMEHSGDGGVSYTSTLCSSCLDTYKDAVRIVCRACRRLQGFLEPTTTPDGFVYEPKKCYHINGCPQCKPGLFHTSVLEHEAWLQARRKAAKPDLDLIQEIEQKSLQAEREVDKVRRELQ